MTKNSPVRVLQVFSKMHRRGAETFIMNVYRKIDRSKVQFDFIVQTKEKGDYDDEIRSLGGNIYYMPSLDLKNGIKFLKAWNDFFNEHRDYKIIHGHAQGLASLYLSIARKHGLKTIIHSHTLSSGKGIKAIVKTFLQLPLRKLAHERLACSKSAGKWLYGNKTEFKIIQNAIDAERYIFDKEKRSIIRDSLNIRNKFVIGHVGVFCYIKNHELIIDIFKIVHDRKPNAVLLLIGSGELEGVIKDKVIRLGLEKDVIFTGSRKDIPDLLFAMDVFIFPSHFEGLGIALIEAQASGLKCFSSDAIPDEAKITDLLERISLTKPAEFWAEEVIKCDYDSGERQNMYESVVRHGYDIDNTAKWLQKLYIDSSES
ncbi:MAG: glycosyltransferase family 1 protein [Deltaproteobacteria bacterium]